MADRLKPHPMAFLAFTVLTLAVGGGTFAAKPASPRFVWWQAEHTVSTNFPASTWLSASTPQQKAALSGGQWLTVSDSQGQTPYFATYNVTVPGTQNWRLWVRKCSQRGPFKYRFDNQPWRYCTNHEALIGNANVRQWFPANWVRLASIYLTAGPHIFTFELTAKPGHKVIAAYDCFALTSNRFIPDGKMRPGQRNLTAAPGWFAWDPSLTESDNRINLRAWNEKRAGATGFVRHIGGNFLLGNGRPVRFWGVNVSFANINQPHALVRLMARRLAAAGVNMVRFHDSLLNTSRSPAIISMRRLHALQYMVWALKQDGIYTDISTYYAAWVTAGALQAKGYRPGQWTSGLLMFDPRVQHIYRQWMRAILTSPDPFNGVPLGQDPAVAIVEIQNEDSLLFWNLSGKSFPSPEWHELEHQFALWLVQRYGSLKAAYATWNRAAKSTTAATNPHDNFARQRIWLYGAWHMTRQGIKTVPTLLPRIRDQVTFLATLQHDFYQHIIAFLHSQLHVKQLISPSNWTTADPTLLDGIERWTYTPGDLMDRHGYFDATHTGPNSAWSVARGQTVIGRPAILHPRAMPFNMIQTAGFPNIMSEIGFDNPNRYRADGLILAAAYGSLDGLAGLDFFAVGNDTLVDHQMSMFQVCSPAMIGQFPAAALIFRRGLVLHEPPAVEEWTAIPGLLSLSAVNNNTIPIFNPLAALVGPVMRHFDTHRTAYKSRNLANYLHPDQGTVASSNHELLWNFKSGLLTINAPAAQGFVGFTTAGHKIKTASAAFALQNRFASVLLVSLTASPLVTSHRLLLQVMTREKPFGFRTSGHKIVAMGSGPWNIKNIYGSVTLTSPPWTAGHVQALRANGASAGQRVKTTRTPTGLTIHLLPNVLYYLITR